MILDNYDIKKENNEKYSEIEIIHEIKQSREKAKINFNNRGKNNGKNIRNFYLTVWPNTQNHF